MLYSDKFTKLWPAKLAVPYGPYRGLVSSVHDGDTLAVLVDCGFGLLTEIQVRVYGIQAPELLTGTAVTKAAGAAARDALTALAEPGSPVRVTTLLATTGEQTRSFVRFVAQVEAASGDVASAMVAAGHAFWCDRNLKPLAGPPSPIGHWVAQELPR